MQVWRICPQQTKPLFRIAGHFWTITKYSGEVSLIISVDIHREAWLDQCVRTLISVEHIEISLYICPNSTVASTFNPRQYLHSLKISKQISCALKGFKRAIPRKLVKISDCRVSSFLKTVPGCRVFRHGEYRNTKIRSTMLGCPWTVCDDKCAGLLTNTRSKMVLRSKISKSHLGTHAFRLKLLQRHKSEAYFWS